MNEHSEKQLRADLLTLTLFIDEVASLAGWVADRVYPPRVVTASPPLRKKVSEVYEAMGRALEHYDDKGCPTWHSQADGYHDLPVCPRCGGTQTQREPIDEDETPCDSDWHVDRDAGVIDDRDDEYCSC